MRKPIAVSKIDVKIDGKHFKKGLDLLRLDTDHFKTFVHAKVRWSADADGSWHLPADVTEDYCRQIVSEARIISPTGKVKWVPRSRQNHFLDCEAMQLAACRLLNFEKLRDGPPARRAPRAEPPETPPSPPSEPPPAKRRAPRAGSVWGARKESIW
jgi:phage terminase large subunit GpA-like protein